MKYTHTQHAPLHYVIEAPAILTLVSAWLLRAETVAAVILTITALVVLLFALAFRTLTVADEGESLAIRFGPLPLFSKRIAYADITRAQAGRSSWLDGWGIHWVPGRGWIYNLWGFDCVELDVGGKTIRIGSDDVDNLVPLLESKIAEATPTA